MRSSSLIAQLRLPSTRSLMYPLLRSPSAFCRSACVILRAVISRLTYLRMTSSVLLVVASMHISIYRIFGLQIGVSSLRYRIFGVILRIADRICGKHRKSYRIFGKGDV